MVLNVRPAKYSQGVRDFVHHIIIHSIVRPSVHHLYCLSASVTGRLGPILANLGRKSLSNVLFFKTRILALHWSLESNRVEKSLH